MSEILNKYNLYIDSSQRISGTADNFKIQLKKPIQRTNDKSRFQFYITSLQYPFSMKQVNSTNNTFTVTMNPGVVTATVTIPEGNYNILTLLNAVIQGTNSALMGIYALSGTYSKVTGLATLTYGTNDAKTFTFNFANTTIGTMLGFKTNVTVSYNNPKTSNVNVNVNPISYFSIRSDTLTASSFDSEALDSSFSKSNILCKVPIRVPSNCYIYYEQPYDSRIVSNIDTLTIIDFKVTMGGNEISMNNALDFSFILVCEEFLINENSGFTTLGDTIANPLFNGVDIEDLKKTREQLVQQLAEARNKLMPSETK